MTQLVDGAAAVRSEILRACREYVEANAAAVLISPDLRPALQARVLDDVTCAFMLEGAAIDNLASRHVAQETRLFLRYGLAAAGMGASLETFVVAGRRRALVRLKAPASIADLRDGASVMPAIESMLDALALGEEWKTTCPTGLRDLDEKLNGGFPLGEMTLVGAPTGSGKTTFAMQVAYHAAQAERGVVLVVSPEMQARALWFRLALRETGFSRHELRKDQPHSAVGIGKVAAKAQQLAERSNLIVLDKLDADIDLAVEGARDLHNGKLGPLYLLVLDYAQQLAKPEGDKARYLEVGKVAHKALEIAKETNAAVLITSQVNSVRGKGGDVIDHTFRESAVLEQKAAVAFVMTARHEDGAMDLTFKKNRDGPMGTVELRYRPASFSLHDMPKEAPMVDHWERSA